MDIKKIILDKLKKNGEVKSSEIVEETGFSRTYIDRFFRELREKGVLILVGKANKARYIPATKESISKVRKSRKEIYKILNNENLQEDEVFSEIEKKTGITEGLTNNVLNIFRYAFTEMLNNAIEHSNSEKVEIKMYRREKSVMFEVRDRGIGIFNNIKKKRGLKSEMAAIQDLIKGKQTTMPESHSGEGIFFTSRAGDILTIQSSKKKIVFDNLKEDIYIRDVRNTKGTRVVFSIGVGSDKNLNEIFKRFTDELYKFSKTEVVVKLYEEGTDYVSRSQARRLLTGLDEFKTIILDFKEIDTIGQAFADEIFRVWQKRHASIKIVHKNANDNVLFMINRALD